MTDNNVLKLSQPSTFSDPLTEVLRKGARSLLAQAVEAEVAAFLGSHAEERTDEGRQRLVRHGHLPEREIMTGIGPVAVRGPRVRDRTGLGADRIRFSSALLPPYARRSKSLEVLIPILYLKGISTGDFTEALAALLGPDAGGLSASSIARLTEVWAGEHAHWLKRDLSARRYVYFWADGIHVQARLEDDAQCLLVIIGATPEGKKELVGLIDGVRESTQSWRELLLDLKRRGLAMGPELAVADGALGFWKAIEEVWSRTRGQRCWVHKTANVLNKLPKSQQSKAKRALPQELRLAGIAAMDEANRYIAETFLPAFNDRFSVPAAGAGSAFLPYVGRALADILAIQDGRQVQNDNTVRYKGLVLQIPEQAHRRHFVKASVKVHEYPDASLAIFHGPRCLARYDQKGELLLEPNQQEVA